MRKLLKGENGQLLAQVTARWKEYFEKLLNEENAWNEQLDVECVEGPAEYISREEVRKATGNLKSGKAGGPSGISAEMLKAAGERGVQWMSDMCNGIVKEEVIPKSWELSEMIPLYKGKGDVLTCSSSRGIKLLEHGMKVTERVFERKLRQRVDIDKMQFGFRPGTGTTDAIFVA